MSTQRNPATDADWQRTIAKAMAVGAISPRRAAALGFTSDMATAWNRVAGSASSVTARTHHIVAEGTQVSA